MKNIEYLIEKFPNIFKDYNGNPGRVNWYCPSGWIEIVDLGLWIIQQHIDNINLWAERDPEKNRKIEQLTCLQIKEKFGGLRLYTQGGDEYCEGIISFLESYSYETCQDCGTNQEIGYTSGWVITCCIKCAKEYKEVWKAKKIDIIDKESL